MVGRLWIAGDLAFCCDRNAEEDTSGPRNNQVQLIGDRLAECSKNNLTNKASEKSTSKSSGNDSSNPNVSVIVDPHGGSLARR